MAGFIAVHCGAGFHSKENFSEYKKLCKRACAAALDVYTISENPVEAVNVAIATLEDSCLTNAGFGSNLTWDGKVECDACVMDGNTMNFGACGAVTSIKNPIALASQICIKQSDNMALGRIPPCMLVGSGAESWAISAGIPHVLNSTLISTKSLDQHFKNKQKLKLLEQSTGSTLGPLDTVGAIFVGEDGRTAAGCSSGGIALKHSGRIGQAATFACGCWAQTMGNCSVATSTSGCGEHLIKTMLAKHIADDIKEGDCPMISIDKSIRNRFLNAEVMQNEEDKFAGALAVKYDPILGKGDLVWGYTTKSMCIGYGDSFKRENTFEASLSRKPDGQEIMVCGAGFQLRDNLDALLASKNMKQIEQIQVVMKYENNVPDELEMRNKDLKHLGTKLNKQYEKRGHSKKRKTERKDKLLLGSPQKFPLVPFKTENLYEMAVEKQIGNVVELGVLSPMIKNRIKNHSSGHDIIDPESVPTIAQRSHSTLSLPEIFKSNDVLEVLDVLKHQLSPETSY